MRVLVTGGTGFVGHHSVTALQAAGHRVRVLARDPSRVRSTDVEVAVGDITSALSVERPVDGCHAVLHAAAVVAIDRKSAGDVAATNVRGAETVLGAAHRAGCDPIVHVSSVAALSTADGPVLTRALPSDDSATLAWLAEAGHL